jgi:taurine--2-oxoglutarate transaminase
MFGAIELVKNRETREPAAPFGGSSTEMTVLKKYLFEKGLFLYTHWNLLLIIPPLIMTEEQLAEGFAIIDEGLVITDKNCK